MHQLFIDFKKDYGSVRREVLYSILIEFGIPMKPVMLIKMCLNDTSSRVRVGRHLSDMFPIKNCLKQGVALLPLLLNFALEYAIRRVWANQDGLKFSGTHQLLVYTGDVSILAGSIHTIKKNVEALAVASKETGLEILSTGSYLEIRMQDKVTIRRLIITSLKGWKSSNIWDQR